MKYKIKLANVYVECDILHVGIDVGFLWVTYINPFTCFRENVLIRAWDMLYES